MERGSENRSLIGIQEDRQGKVRSWSEMSFILEKMYDLNSVNIGFARDYFRAQRLRAEEKNRKAKYAFKSLDKKTGFKEFKENNDLLLRTIEIAVIGRTDNNNSNS